MQAGQRAGRQMPQGRTRWAGLAGLRCPSPAPVSRGSFALCPGEGTSNRPPRHCSEPTPDLGVPGPRPWAGVSARVPSRPCPALKCRPHYLLPSLSPGPGLALYCALIDTKYRFPISRAVMV